MSTGGLSNDEPPRDGGSDVAPTIDLDAARDDVGSADAATEADTGPDAAQDPHLVGAWSFEETSGSIAHDSSGHARDAVLIGTPSFVSSGVRGGAIELHGSDAIAINALAGAGFPRTGSVSLWFRWDSMNAANSVGLLDDYAADRNHVFIRHPDGAPVGTWQAALQHASDAAPYVWVDEFDIAAGKWTQLVLTWDEQAKMVSWYVDGGLKAKAAYSAPFAPADEIVLLGKALVGAIDEVRIYDRVLDATDVAALR